MLRFYASPLVRCLPIIVAVALLATGAFTPQQSASAQTPPDGDGADLFLPFVLPGEQTVHAAVATPVGEDDVWVEIAEVEEPETDLALEPGPEVFANSIFLPLVQSGEQQLGTVMQTAVTDLIFADGFESGNSTAWNGRANATSMYVASSAALVGSWGMGVNINSNTSTYVVDDRPSAEPRYRARFYFDPNSVRMGTSDSHYILIGYAGSSTAVVRVEMRLSSGSYQLRAAFVNNSSTWTTSNWFPISDAPHYIEIDWLAATAAGARNGGLTLWIDGVQNARFTTGDNNTRRIDRIRLGAASGIDSGTRGTYLFDAFESRRQTYIGPASTTPEPTPTPLPPTPTPLPPTPTPITPTATPPQPTPTPLPSLPTPPANTFQPTAPYYATFYYPWHGNPAVDGGWSYWTGGNSQPPNTWYGHYLPDPLPKEFDPTRELYSSTDAAMINWQLSKMAEAKIEVAISSWWGQGDRTDRNFGFIVKDVMKRSSNPYPNLRWSVYYEDESTGDPSVAQIVSDLNYIASSYAVEPGYLKIGGKPVIFVYSTGSDTAGMVQRWHDAKLQAGTQFYVVLKLFSGYRTVSPQPDGWHQYGPAARSNDHSPYSFAVSPGFWYDSGGEAPRLTRDLQAFRSAVSAMVASNATWKLITTWNEWGEGTAVEPGEQVIYNSSTGREQLDPAGTPFKNAYVDILRELLPALGNGTG